MTGKSSKLSLFSPIAGNPVYGIDNSGDEYSRGEGTQRTYNKELGFVLHDHNALDLGLVLPNSVSFHSPLRYNSLKLRVTDLIADYRSVPSLIWSQNDNILLNTLNLLDLFTFKSSGLSVDVKENSASSICLFDKFVEKRFGTSANCQCGPS